MKLSLLPQLLLAITLTGCASSRIPGSNALVTLRGNSSQLFGMKIAVAPILIDGGQGQHLDHATTNLVTARLMHLGYDVIAWESVEATARTMGVSAPATEEGYLRLARTVKLDAIVLGTIEWVHLPGRSDSYTETLTAERREIRNGTSRRDTVYIREEIPTVKNRSVESSYTPVSQSLRVIGLPDGEVLLTGYVRSSSYYQMTDELFDGIARQLALR